MNHTIAKLKIKANMPPGIARAKAEFELELAHKVRKDKRELAKQVKELSAEAKHYAEIIINAYSRLGQAWVAKSGDLAVQGKDRKKRKLQRVRFSQCFTTPERIYYRIEINRRHMGIATKNVLPHMTTVAELTRDETLFELSHACTRLVTAIRDDYNHGVWIVVNRGVGADGVPLHINYSDMLEILADAYDANYFGAPVVVGIGLHRTTYTLQFSDHPHWLVAGTSGGGKSNELNNMICTWIRFMSPDDLKLVLIDLKRMEFKRYSKLPHLLLPVIVEGDEAVHELEELMREIERRKIILAEGDEIELGEWNKAHPDQKMPRIVVIIDELAELMLSSGKLVRAAIETLLSRISNVGRAVGVHIIAATQLPQSRVIPAQITGNMTAKIGARTSSWRESLLIIGTGDLQNLPNVKGRMMFKYGADKEKLQTPHVMPEDKTEAVHIAFGRAAGVIYLQGEHPMLDAEGATCYIADHLDGDLGAGRLWKALEPLAVPHKQLVAMWHELVSREAISAQERIFDVVKGPRGYKLVERIHERAPKPAEPYEVDFTIDPQVTVNRLRLEAAPTMLMLPAPGETSSEGQPAPIQETTLEPAPISPLLMTDDQIVDKFIEECCTRDKRKKDRAATLYAGYEKFCDELMVRQISKKSFAYMLKARGYESKKNGDGNMVWLGLEISKDAGEGKRIA